MSSIALMPEELANQIAAGEVVERPASVVKELVENSLDAGAHRIDVEIEEGGLKLLRITDDGSGMTPQDAELCLLRHATSKLRCADDLFRLATMGFRGEALASIASVSRLTLTTRTQDAVAAHRIVTESGHKQSPSREVGGSVGTQIEVRDLFFNVPARLKFMKSESTETGHIAETLIRLSLAFPGVHFKLVSKGKVTLDLPPHKSQLERSQAALASRGRGAGRPTLYLAQGSADGVLVEAHLGAPDEATMTARNVFLLVNRRFVRDRSLTHAAQAGYGELLERGRSPLLVLHVQLDTATVDVNVHPQKLEVRMANADAVYGLVRSTVRNVAAQAPWLLGVTAPGRAYVVGSGAQTAGSALHEAAPAYSAAPVQAATYRAVDSGAAAAVQEEAAFAMRAGGGAQVTGYASAPRVTGTVIEQQLPLQPRWSPGAGLSEHRARLRQAVALYAPTPEGEAVHEPLLMPPAALPAAVQGIDATAAPSPAPTQAPAFEIPASSAGLESAAVQRMTLAQMTYLGQLLSTYLLCEQEGELVLIDQHAAHERVVFERLRKAHQGAPLASQRLLFPTSLEFDDKRLALLEEHSETLTRLGFEIRPFGGRSFALVGAPDLGAYGRGAQVHRDPEKLLRQVLDELEEGGRTSALQERTDLLLATMACHAAVRAGDVLDATRATALLQAMDEVDYSPYCPHGRPVLVRMTKAEIERRFLRT